MRRLRRRLSGRRLAAVVAVQALAVGLSSAVAATPAMAALHQPHHAGASLTNGPGARATGTAPGRAPHVAGLQFGPSNLFDYNSFRCIGIAAGQPYAAQWDCTANHDQVWHSGLTVASNWVQVINGNNQCLGTAGGNTTRGTRITAFSCAGDPNNQFWSFVPAPVSGTYYLENFAAALAGRNYVVGVEGGSTANGAKLVLWDMLTHPDQYWGLAAR